MIREEEPPRPSTRLSTTEELPSIAACRHVEPRKLSGLVRGELDWIVMKALEKDRNRRYETANGLAADLRRYLDDEPVQACPPSAWYRLSASSRAEQRAGAGRRGCLAGTDRRHHRHDVGLCAASGHGSPRPNSANWHKPMSRRPWPPRRPKRRRRRRPRSEKPRRRRCSTSWRTRSSPPPGREGPGRRAGPRSHPSRGRRSRPAVRGEELHQPAAHRSPAADDAGNIVPWTSASRRSRPSNSRRLDLYTQHRGPDHPDTLGSMNNLAISYDVPRPARRGPQAQRGDAGAAEGQARPRPPRHAQSMNNLAISYQTSAGTPTPSSSARRRWH